MDSSRIVQSSKQTSSYVQRLLLLLLLLLLLRVVGLHSRLLLLLGLEDFNVQDVTLGPGGRVVHLHVEDWSEELLRQ